MDAAHPLAAEPVLRLSDVLGSPLVLVETGARLRAVIDNAFARMSMDAAPVVETNSIQTLKRLVTGSNRLTLLNRLDVAHECAQGTLVFPSAGGAVPRSPATGLGGTSPQHDGAHDQPLHRSPARPPSRAGGLRRHFGSLRPCP